jgi:TonB family protein
LPASAQLDRFQGAWDNTNAETRGIVRIRIDTAKVQVYGACHPDPCDWGQEEATAYGPGVSADLQTEARALLAHYKTAFSETILIIKPSGTDEFEVESYTRFIDGSRRTAYMNRETLRRSAKTPANTGSERIQNIAPEAMWKRVTQCVFPTYPGLAFNAHITGAVSIGLGISPSGDVANYRVLDGPPLLVQSAVDAIRQWKFQPNEVRGEVTWSRVRAVIRFNDDGTTTVDLSPAILLDNFGDAGTARSAAAAFPRPASASVCKSVQPWTGTEAQQLPTFKTPEDVGAFMQTYYLRPRPELIADVVDALHSTGFLQKATAAPPTIGFFSEVFAANPDRRPEWQVLIAKQDEQTKAALERALSESKAGGVRSIDGHSAELNDEYWGAFFASGNPDFLKKIIDQLRYSDERDDFSLFMTGVSAQWSLASNAQNEDTRGTIRLWKKPAVLVVVTASRAS